MTDLAHLTLDAFLNRTGERTPTPGGGSVTGLAGALSCALAQMVARFSIRKDTKAEDREQIDKACMELQRADAILRGLITEDANAYDRMKAADAARKKADDDSADNAHQEAVIAASGAPLEMAALASASLATMDSFKHVANVYLLSDLGIAATLAEATAKAARYTLRVNSPLIADADRREKLLSNMDRILLHCANHLASIEAFVHRHLDGNG